jgi:5-methylcytosine-specific restriction endonuclease McrA
MTLFRNAIIQENPNKTYSDLLKTPQWLRKRKLILMRDNNQCINCNTHKNLQVHHKQYQYNSTIGDFVAPWDYDNKYLITLCRKCHGLGHDLYKVPVIKINKP